MDPSYSTLLEKTRLPQPTFQRYAVLSLFQKLRSAPPALGLASDAGRDALSRCLRSPHPAVADQSARELCRLVKDGRLPLSVALVELQAALEGCDPYFVPLFVKAIGFLCRLGFRKDASWGRRFDPVELHPFVKVLSCREEAQAELIQQVLLFIVHNKTVGIEAVARFLRPFLMFSVIQMPFSFSSSMFARNLISSVASVSCSFPSEGISIIKLLTSCLKYSPCTSEEEFKNFICFAEYMMDAILVVLKHTIGIEPQTTSNVQACSVELLDVLLSSSAYLYTPRERAEIILELSKRLLVAQKELGLHYLPEFIMVIISICIILTQVEFEHENLSILKLLIFLIKWKTESDYNARGAGHRLSEELLFVFPVINLLSSYSTSVKAAADNLLSTIESLLSGLSLAPDKTLISDAGSQFMSKPESIPFRLLSYLWFQQQSTLYLNYLGFSCKNDSEVKKTNCERQYWTSQLKEYIVTSERGKTASFSQSSETPLTGMHMLLSSIASVLIVHPILGASAVDSLSAIALVEPKLAMPLLQAILFYSKMLYSSGSDSPEILLKLLEMLPSLSRHSAMVPLIIQTILPMLQKDAKPMLYAVAVRLLCKTWAVTDRAFGTLQEVLDSKAFSDFISEREICISIAASVRDVCRQNSDRGVDLILSVSSCIESRDSTVQALGFESLAYLCESDAVDFYTAWNVVSRHTMDYSIDPIVAHGLCTLLRWGAVDAAAYPENSKNVVQILWQIGTSKSSSSESLWLKARASAFKSLSHYEVAFLQEVIMNFKERNLQCLLAEENAEVLAAMEGLQIKIINFDHLTRRRVVREKRPMVHKVEKLLDVFPHAIFSSGKHNLHASELPGTALLSLVFTPKGLKGTSKGLAKLHAAYEKALLEIAESLHVSRNILLALLALQSWKAFVHRWMRAVITFADANESSDVSDKSSKAANDISEILCNAAAESIPRVAINIALAIGALCMVLPPSAHAVVSVASNFLLKWLFEYEHEHQQWSAAISLGLVSNCFPAMDRKQKFEVITGLLKVFRRSKSHLVRGACGVGLGFACQDLLTTSDVDSSSSEGRTIRLTEATLLRNIVRTLSETLSQLCPSASDSLMSLKGSLLLSAVDAFEEEKLNLPYDNCNNLEEDAWGIAGIVLGLGNSIVAIYRFGDYDAVLKIKDMLISWIPYVESTVHISSFCSETSEIPLSMGSCLALPAAVAFCQRSELMDNVFDVLFNRYVSLISELLTLKKSGNLHQNWVMASCTGVGLFLSYVLHAGVHSMRFDDITYLLDILRGAYTQSYPPLVHLGGMLGVVNAFGAGAGDLSNTYPQITFQINNEQKESEVISGPILATALCETLSTSMVQELFFIAKESKDDQIRKYAAWAVSFLRQQWWSKEFQNVNDSESSSADSNPSQSFAEDSFILKLSLWLKDINLTKKDEITHANTVATVLRCLSKAPRLPLLDWGGITRLCMRFGAQFSVKETPNLLREECVLFSLAHATDVSSLLLLLDEVTDLSRFRTLELNLQSKLLYHFSDLLKIFSASRMGKLCEDMVTYFRSSASSYVVDIMDDRSILRVSFWKGLRKCFADTTEESILSSSVKKCLECLFDILPILSHVVRSEGDRTGSVEWSEAIRCMSKAPPEWLVDMLQIPDISLFHEKGHFNDVAKRYSAKARLVRIGCIPISDLDELKPYILNASSEGIWWNVLLDVVSAVSTAEGNSIRRWLLDALEICYMTKYPSTVLRFIGLLSGSCCKYMPLLLVDPDTVLRDLPVTLPSLLSDSSWTPIASTVAEKLWASTERICTWASRLAGGNGLSSEEHIDDDEANRSALLAHVMHQACISLKDYLPLPKQSRLANLDVS